MPSVVQVRELLELAFPGDPVEVVDTTGTGDHFAAAVTSARFAGLGRVDQHRLVYDAVREHLSSGAIHALQIQTRVPATHDQGDPT
jgi:stress-induced morphogen